VAETLNANALRDDPALAKIRSCGEFLNPMPVSGALADDSSCHWLCVLHERIVVHVHN